jgi:hypothetical protein
MIMQYQGKTRLPMLLLVCARDTLAGVVLEKRPRLRTGRGFGAGCPKCLNGDLGLR